MFRTYNASITLDALLHKESTTETLEEKKAEYDRANKEVRFSNSVWCSTVTPHSEDIGCTSMVARVGAHQAALQAEE